MSVIDADLSVLRAQGDATVQQIETIAPVSFFTTPKGERVIDFGQNLTGWVAFSVKGRAGDKVVLRHFEVLDAQGMSTWPTFAARNSGLNTPLRARKKSITIPLYLSGISLR